MVEYKTYKLEEEKKEHIETVVIEDVGIDRFFLNEDLGILVALNSANSAGQLQFFGDTSHVADLAVCYKDPSNGEIIKVKDLDPEAPINFKDEEVVRVRYEVDGGLEEAHLVHRNRDAEKTSRIKPNITTPRMRRIHQSGLSFE